VSDPSEIGSFAGERLGETPCAGRRVLVAGNGSLVEAAQAVFSRSSKLVLLSNDHRALDAKTFRLSSTQGPTSRRLGVLNDRGALERILEIERPELVFADFSTGEAGLDNACEAYARTILAPLEKIAAEVSHRPPARLVAFERRAGTGSHDALRATELVLLDVFRRDPSRCAIVRIEGEPTAREWCALIAELGAGGGVFGAVSSDEAAGKFAIVSYAIDGAVPETGRLRLMLERSLDEGDAAAMTRVLSEMASLSPVREHAS
jgi:hypothetical protein